MQLTSISEWHTSLVPRLISSFHVREERGEPGSFLYEKEPAWVRG